MKFLCPLLILFSVTIGTADAALVGHWPLDTDASDATGNGHDGTVVGGTVNFGQPGANANTGSSAAFPDNGHIDVPYAAALNPGIQAPDGSGSFTVALWANSSDNAGFNSPFTAREDNGVSVNGPIIYNNNSGNWSYWAGNNGAPGAWNALDTDPVPLNTWQHVAITYDADTVTRKMFIDGVEVVSANLGVSANVLRDIHIGSGQDNGLNFYWNGLIDDVGVWDEALDQSVIQSVMANGISSGLPDPGLSVPNPINLALDGTVQSFDIPITNSGQSVQLSVSAATFTGDPNFSVSTLPDPIDPGGTGNLVVAFNPAGANGAFSADLEITSNDSLNPMRTVTLQGVIHDPMIVTDATVGLGTNSTGTITVTNDGASRPLNISDVQATGDAANFSFTNIPAQIAAGGGTGTIDVSFDPMGGEGFFSATVTITTDDPINPSTVVTVTAFAPFSKPLVAWWPLDVDSTDASGNGFDGVDVGAITYSQPGANPATGSSANFTGTEHIDIPWDPALNSEDFTVTLWANAAASGGGSFRSPITNRDDVAPGGVNRHGWIIYNNNNGNWSFWNGAGLGSDGGWNVADAGAVTTNTWNHLAITYDSATNTKNFYIDGTAVSTTNPVGFSPNDSTLADGLTHEDEDLHIGGGGDTGTSFRWEGGIDDVGLFRVALPEADIETIMNSGVSGFTGSGTKFQMLSIEFGPEPGEISVTFTSVDGAKYAVDRSTDLTSSDPVPTTSGSWEELTDDYDSQGDTTTFVDQFPPAGATRLFYRARRVE